MSVEAMSSALNLAPVPADRGRQPPSACKFVLVGLGNHTGQPLIPTRVMGAGYGGGQLPPQLERRRLTVHLPRPSDVA